MVEYIKAVAVKAVGVFFVSVIGTLGTVSMDFGVSDFGDAFEAAAAATLATVVWPAASKLAAKAAATNIPQV